jgi:hypothetical protein
MPKFPAAVVASRFVGTLLEALGSNSNGILVGGKKGRSDILIINIGATENCHGRPWSWSGLAPSKIRQCSPVLEVDGESRKNAIQLLQPEQ